MKGLTVKVLTSYLQLTRQFDRQPLGAELSNPINWKCNFNFRGNYILYQIHFAHEADGI